MIGIILNLNGFKCFCIFEKYPTMDPLAAKFSTIRAIINFEARSRDHLNSSVIIELNI